MDRLSREGDRYVVAAGKNRLEADHVVVAAGTYQRPRIPTFAAELDPGIPARSCGRRCWAAAGGFAGFEVLAIDNPFWRFYRLRGWGPEMAGILLVQGAWHGPWCWDGVAERLRPLVASRALARELFFTPTTPPEPADEVWATT